MPLPDKKSAPGCLFADKSPRQGARLAVTLAAIFLAACSSEGLRFRISWSDFSNTLAAPLIKPSSDVTLDQAKAVPYASLGVKVGDGPQAMLVLADGTGPELSWTSASHISLITRDGRIIGSAGFEHNLSGFQSRTAERSDFPRTLFGDRYQRSGWWISVTSGFIRFQSPVLRRQTARKKSQSLARASIRFMSRKTAKPKTPTGVSQIIIG